MSGVNATLEALMQGIYRPRALPRLDERTTRLARAKRMVRALAKRRYEALPLYRPLPAAEEFHRSTAKWRVVVGSNRSGKTLAGAVEFSRAFLNCDPYQKYPAKINALVVGLDSDHLAMQWRKCYEEGAFYLVRDEITRLWRAVRADANDPRRIAAYDWAYRETWKPAPPLIPRRSLAALAWEDQKKGIPRFVRSIGGSKALFRSSEGKSPQGDHYNIAWLDEQLGNEDFYREARRGLVELPEDQGHPPLGIWTATPQDINVQLLDLMEAAKDNDPHVMMTELLIVDNPFIPESEKEAFYAGMSEEEREVRWFGRPAVYGRRIYNVFNMQQHHGCEGFPIPPTWARYVVLDPGRQCCGTLFAAVDPDEDHVWIYDGFTLKNSDAVRWADQVRQREGQQKFEAVICDMRGGRQRPMGASVSVAGTYRRALDDAGVHPRIYGPLDGFLAGTDDVMAREEAVLNWMHLREIGPNVGTPKLQIFRGTLPELERQIIRAHYDLRKAKKRIHGEEDLLVCLEYLAAANPGYRHPERRGTETVDPVYAAYLAHNKRRQARSQGPRRHGALVLS